MLLPNYIRMRISEIKGFGRNTSYYRTTSYSRLVQEAINFTQPILKENRIKRLPSYRISYYQHKKFMGIYNGEIVIYVNTAKDIPSLVDTVLHEVMHYIQAQTNKQYRLYDEYTRSYGYHRNPFEVECRAFAAQHTAKCIEHLAAKNIIKQAA